MIWMLFHVERPPRRVHADAPLPADLVADETASMDHLQDRPHVAGDARVGREDLRRHGFRRMRGEVRDWPVDVTEMALGLSHQPFVSSGTGAAGSGIQCVNSISTVFQQSN